MHEEQLLQQQQQLQHEPPAYYPGASGVPVPRPRVAEGSAAQALPDDSSTLGSAVGGLGSAVYAAGAATAGAAGSMFSGLWNWATDASPRLEPPPEEVAPMELQPLHSAREGGSEVISRGAADVSESGGAGEVRRRARRAPVSGAD